jgi:2-amino-4-hydroxy-6-hydroxymethyldihydropteridine diphosphokinase
MQPETAYIGLGANLGDPLTQLNEARNAIAALPQTRLTAASRWYCSKPLPLPDGRPDADHADYINGVVRIATSLQPAELLEALQAIELAHGRDRHGPRWRARPVDLDILLYGQMIIESPRLHVPHPGLVEREFVLYPLYDIEPQLVLPDGRRLEDLLADCPLRGLDCLPASLSAPG